MGWNLRSRVTAMAVALQVTPGVFVQPSTATGLIPVSVPTYSEEEQTADDPTATGTVWDSLPVVLGSTATVGATFPLRGPGGASPPLANAWPQGLIFQAAGWTEIRKAASSGGVLQAGSSTTALALANTESAVDDALLGMIVQSPAVGAGFQTSTMVRDYAGSSKTAVLAETMGQAPAAGVAYTIPAQLVYLLGTLSTQAPALSISIWRDKKRIDFKDWRPTSLSLSVPVANRQNTEFPSCDFSGEATVVAEVDDAAPQLPSSVLQVAIPPARGGKFMLDSTLLGHQSLRFTETLNAAAPSNQNQDTGEDARETISGSRSVDLDLNDSTVSTFNLRSRVTTQKVLPIMSMWGGGSGNNFGLLLPNNLLRPFSPGDRNGFYSTTGTAAPTDLDKSVAFAIWW